MGRPKEWHTEAYTVIVNQAFAGLLKPGFWIACRDQVEQGVCGLSGSGPCGFGLAERGIVVQVLLALGGLIGDPRQGYGLAVSGNAWREATPIRTVAADQRRDFVQ
jgi:hypothetical protein